MSPLRQRSVGPQKGSAVPCLKAFGPSFPLFMMSDSPAEKLPANDTAEQTARSPVSGSPSVQDNGAKPSSPKRLAPKSPTTSSTRPPVPTPPIAKPERKEGNGAKEKDHAESRFVKVFILDEDGKWADRGTGHADCLFVEKKESWCLVVRTEDDSSVLLNSTIRPDAEYVRQQDTLLVWTESTGEDLALSFQDVEACHELWQELENIQMRLAADKHDIDQLPETPRSNTEEIVVTQDLELSEPTLGNLQRLEKTISFAFRTESGRRELIRVLYDSEFLANLFPVFEQSEDLEDMENLFSLSVIVRCIMSLNEGPMYEFLLKDDIFPQLLGVLEYDRDVPKSKASHREHFQKHANFKQIVPIKNEEIRAKIVQTYRVQYLKDVALARVLDDGTFTALITMTFYNQLDVLTFVKEDPSFLKDLFAILNGPDASHQQKKDAIFFLRELFSMTKQLQSANRMLYLRSSPPDAFYRTLINHGMFTALSAYLGSPDLELRTAVAAITAHLIDHDANMVRSLTQAQFNMPAQQPFFELLVDRLLDEQDAGLRSQYAEMIRALLETAALDASEGIVPHSKSAMGSMDSFLQLVYDKWVAKLIRPILEFDIECAREADDSSMSSSALTSRDRPALCNHICDLLCFMIRQHAARSKYICLTSPVIPKVAALLHAPQGYLRLSALRVIRVCFGMKDDFYYIQIILKKEVLKHVMQAFIDVKAKYNLLNSACLELFEFIVRENPKPIVAHLVTKYRADLVDVTYVKTCQKLIHKYEQNVHPPPEANTPETPDIQPARDGFRKDKSEDDWFNADDGDDEEIGPSPASPGLSVTVATTPPHNPSPKKPTVTSSSPRSSHTIEFVRASPDLRLQGSNPSPPPPRLPLVDYPDDDDDDEDDVLAALANRRTSVSSSSTLSPKPAPLASRPSPTLSFNKLSGPTGILPPAKKILFTLKSKLAEKRAASDVDEDEEQRNAKKSKLGPGTNDRGLDDTPNTPAISSP
ncbi:Platinum sensitivity protein [Geranomyces variabilis]|uniref:Platinum sensitivity protein n=1 Tax=Geranomyces variabilis TaxID=109894 RepID=A0AAD5TR83_9FUNG|nr:Platinum sensitivity protein [Geranomyces variabilis]